MKDYTDYHETNHNDKMADDGALIFNYALETSPESYDVMINNTIKRRVILYGKYEENRKRRIIGERDVVDLGNLISVNDEHWLVTSLPEDNGIYRKADLTICNTSIKVTTDKTRVLLRDENGNIITDIDGRPEYEDKIIDKDEPCIVESKGFSVNGKQLLVPDDTLLVTLKYQTAENLRVNEIIRLYNDDYKIKYIDKTNVINSKGLMTLTVENVADKVVNP